MLPYSILLQYTAPCLSFAAGPDCHFLCPFIVATAADLPQSEKSVLHECAKFLLEAQLFPIWRLWLWPKDYVMELYGAFVARSKINSFK